jgi:hypothetical protein
MTAFWRGWLMLWCWGVFVFGAVLTLGAFPAADGLVRMLLEPLGGGLPLEMTPHLRFSLAVMGPVSMGWAFTLMAAIQAAIALGDKGRPIWLLTTLGVLTWFTIDSILSVTTGFWRNVIPNVVLVVGYLIPLFRAEVFKRR